MPFPRRFLFQDSLAWRLGLVLWLIAPLSALAPAVANTGVSEPADEEIIELAPIAVTGSRTRGESSPGHLPATILTREQLEAAGHTRLAEALRKLPWNSQGAQSQGFLVNGRNSLGYLNLRGLGPNRTLVLVNGRRLALSPEANGEFANLNHLPMAAVERVEILREGASAVYGSDAIGGVVNVVLKREFEGWEAGLGGSHSELGADEQNVSLSAGHVGSSINVVWALEHSRRESIKTVDRISQPGEMILDFNPIGDPGTWFLTDWWGDGSMVPGPWTAHGNCPPERLRSLGNWFAIHPDTGLPVGPESLTLCALRLSDQNDWSPNLDAAHAFMNAELDRGDAGRLFGRVLLDRLESHATLTTGGDLPYAIAATNPLNPRFDPALGKAPGPVSVYFELGQLGDLERRTHSDFRSVTLGGSMPVGSGEVEYAVQYERDGYAQSIANLALRSELRAAIERGEFDPFSQHNNPSVVEGLRYTQNDRGRTRNLAADITWQSRWEDRPERHLTYLVGGLEARREAFEYSADPQDAALNVFGFVPGTTDVDARRDVASLFVEAGFAAGSRVRLVYSGRYDRYDLPDVGEMTHKLSWNWRWTPDLLLRASIGQGFRAPSLQEMAAPRVPGLAFLLIDVAQCRSVGFIPGTPECFPRTLLSYELANSKLQPETSVNWNLGLAWHPSANLALELDAWSVDLEDQIATPTAQQVLNLEAQGRLPPGSSVLRDAGGFAREIFRGRVNYPTALVRGVDLSLDWTLPDSRKNSWRLFSWWSVLDTYEVRLVEGVPEEELAGSNHTPRWKSQTGLEITRDAFSANLTIHGVDEFGEGAAAVARWWSVDVRLNWNTRWRARLSAGVRNVTDKQPANLSVRHHDYDGRTWFFRYRQEF